MFAAGCDDLRGPARLLHLLPLPTPTPQRLPLPGPRRCRRRCRQQAEGVARRLRKLRDDGCVLHPDEACTEDLPACDRDGMELLLRRPRHGRCLPHVRLPGRPSCPKAAQVCSCSCAKSFPRCRVVLGCGQVRAVVEWVRSAAGPFQALRRPLAPRRLRYHRRRMDCARKKSSHTSISTRSLEKPALEVR